MKKLISFTSSYFLFYLGHIVYLIFVQYGMCYNIYNWLMDNSEKIQTWGGNKTPWKKLK